MPLAIRPRLAGIAAATLFLAPAATRLAAAEQDMPVAAARRYYAIVVGSNAAETLTDGSDRRETPLSFAAEDAIMNAEVLELAGYETTVLATHQGHNSNGMPVTFDPTKDEVVFAIRKVVEKVERGSGPANVVFWYSGHGDTEGLYLARMNLTNQDLVDTLLKPLVNKATVHVIIDACGALAFTKGGGDVEVVPAKEAGAIKGKVIPISAKKKARGLNPEGFPNVGIIVATTLKQAAIEDPALRAGLLSYQLRSALLNGADASAPADATGRWAAGRDSRITYREAEAFVWAANARVDDDDVRMYVWARGPANDPYSVLLEWPNRAGGAGRRPLEITMSGDDSAHFWVQDADVPNGPHLFRINKGREQQQSVGARFFVPPRAHLKIGNVDGTIRIITAPLSGTISWADIMKQRPKAQAKLSMVQRQALDTGHFGKPYTTEVYTTYDELKNTRKRTNAVLIKGSDNEDSEDEPAPASPPIKPIPIEPVTRTQVSVLAAPSAPQHAIGAAPILLLGGAAAAALSGYFARREADQAFATWGQQEQGSSGYKTWGDRTANWDHLAMASLVTAGVLAASGAGLFYYRWRKTPGGRPTVGFAGTSMRVTF